MQKLFPALLGLFLLSASVPSWALGAKPRQIFQGPVCDQADGVSAQLYGALHEEHEGDQQANPTRGWVSASRNRKKKFYELRLSSKGFRLWCHEHSPPARDGGYGIQIQRWSCGAETDTLGLWSAEPKSLQGRLYKILDHHRPRRMERSEVAGAQRLQLEDSKIIVTCERKTETALHRCFLTKKDFL